MVRETLVAMQVGATSLVDEGISTVLDTLQDRANVNALFLATPTWSRGTGGRQMPGHAFPDHGPQEYDPDWVGGNYANIHPEYYQETLVGAAGRAPEYSDWDIFEETLPAAQARGIESFAWMVGNAHFTPELMHVANLPKCLEVDAWGRPVPRFCFNNPDYRAWQLSIVEDYAKSYDLDGIAWCAEQPGPLNMLMQRPVGADDISCFCVYCRRIGQERGIDVRRTQEGYRKALAWNAQVAEGNPPSDGVFVSFWRLLLQYPELLAWQKLWTDSQHQMYRDIYGLAKACKPEMRVGWHVYHNISFNPFYRADQDYAEMSLFSDFIKVVTYNNCAGPRFDTWVRQICQSLFADATPTEAYPFLMRLLGLEEGPFEEIAARGFSADYVRRETSRAVRAVGGRCHIYPGIDLDIPIDWSPADKHADAVTECSREGVRDAVLAAFDGGAQGVVLSRKYSEMRLELLDGVGDAMASLG